jgi:hypothetical protein
MATQVRHKEPLSECVFIRLTVEQKRRFNECGGVLYIRALIDADIAKEARRAKIKRLRND